MFNIRRLNDEDRIVYQDLLDSVKGKIVSGGKYYVFHYQNENRLLYKLSNNGEHIFYEIRVDSLKDEVIINNFSYDETTFRLTTKFNNYLLIYDCLYDNVFLSSGSLKECLETVYLGFKYEGICTYLQFDSKNDKLVAIVYSHPVVPNNERQIIRENKFRKPYIVCFRNRATRKVDENLGKLTDETYMREDCIYDYDNFYDGSIEASKELFYRTITIANQEFVPFYDRRPYPYDEIEGMLIERGFKTEVPKELILANNREGVNVDYLMGLVDETLTLEESLDLKRTKKNN